MINFSLWGVVLVLQFVYRSEKEIKKNTLISPAGNRTPVSRVTGGDTHHYTTEELTSVAECL